jgi:thiosulfate/3-mercaptopyruvate sulfurtransferase
MTTMTMPLISAAALRTMCDAGQAPLLIDTRFDLADPQAGERAWHEGHLPGAHHLHLDRDLSGSKTGQNGRHPLPTRADFAQTLSRIGVTPERHVVVLDAQGGMFAARAWWLLLWMGHERVAVLDGGLAAWVQAGGSVTTAPPSPGGGPPYPQRQALVHTLDADALQAQLGRVRLIDARAGERFRGEVEPLDAQAGHIPGARNRFFKDNLAADGCFKPSAQLRAEFDALLGADPPDHTIHQCGSGVTACHNLLAMAHAGLPGSRLYAGSWSEWSADPARPVARG